MILSCCVVDFASAERASSCVHWLPVGIRRAAEELLDRAAFEAHLWAQLPSFEYVDDMPRSHSISRGGGTSVSASMRTRRRRCARSAAARAHFFRPPSRAAARSYRVGRAGWGVVLRSNGTCTALSARGFAEGAARAPPARAQDGARNRPRRASEMLEVRARRAVAHHVVVGSRCARQHCWLSQSCAHACLISYSADASQRAQETVAGAPHRVERRVADAGRRRSDS